MAFCRRKEFFNSYSHSCNAFSAQCVSNMPIVLSLWACFGLIGAIENGRTACTCEA